MKKIISILMVFIIMLFFTACGDYTKASSSDIGKYGVTRSSSDTTVLEDINPEFADVDESELTIFVFSKVSCNLIFMGTPDEAFQKAKNGRDLWNYASMSSNGETLTVKLTDDLIREWKRSNLNLLNSTIEGTNSKDKTHVEISRDYKTINYEGIENGFEFSGLFTCSALMQVLNNKDGDAWTLDITLKNYESKNIVWQGTMPGGNISLKQSDWDV